MKLNDIYLHISPVFRKRRIQRFLERFKPTEKTRILDLGGMPQFWAESGIKSQITLLNLYPIDIPDFLQGRCEAVIGDGTNMSYADGEFDIVFSNSVIEHLSTWENQVKMAREIARVGRQYYVQTPSREFFIEPHLLAPFIHWLPKSKQRPLFRNATIWGLIMRPSPERVDEFLEELRLLTVKEMEELFPGSIIEKEKFLGMTKSCSAIYMGKETPA